MKNVFLYFVAISFAGPFVADVVADDAIPILTARDITVSEDTGEAVIELKLDQPSTKFVRVSYSTRFGNARPGLDFGVKAGRVTFPPGSTSQSIRVAINNDSVDEPSQFFWVFLRNSSGLTLGTSRVRITIEDDDPPPSIRFRHDVTSIVEGTSNDDRFVNVTIELSHRSEHNIRFHAYTAFNTASELEFVPVSERVLFDAPGVLFNYKVGIVPDSDLEGRQQFYVYLRNPSNSVLDISESTLTLTDRIRTKVQIVDDDELTTPSVTQPEQSFVWIGTFGRKFTALETATIAKNNDLVVLAKFHANFDIESHHEAAANIKELDPSTKVLPYFNPKFWFVESDWNTTPNLEWLIRDVEGEYVFVDTDRSTANYLDLRIPACRDWILDTVESWLEEGVYDGIAFDSATPVGDFGDGTYWQDLLGGQSHVDDWNAGLAILLSSAQARFADQIVLFNGFGESIHRGPDRDLFQLAYTGGALNELFAIELDGQPNGSLMDDIELMRSTSDKVLLMKSNLRDSGDAAENRRAGRFAYGAFMMGWTPGSSYFKFAVDDFYTTSELEDDVEPAALDLGLPTSDYVIDGAILFRHFQYGVVVLNTGHTEQTWSDEDFNQSVPALDALFLQYTD